MAIGTTGKYERLDVLGHGTSGVVYLAWDTLLRRQVALKEIRAAAPEMERVLHEARVLDRLRHPNIVQVHSVDQQNGAVLIDMELVRGQNLADLLRERNGAPLPAREAGRIALAVLEALQYAHERRIIHRDVKPANILVGKDGVVKLTDFGLAEALGSGSVAGGGGTYPYMAPEDFAEEESSDYRSDLWAVGVVLYEMLTGRRPFAVPPGRRANDPYAWQRAIHAEEPPPVAVLRPELPAALGAVVSRALAKNKADRFPSARAFADALRAALAGAALPDEEATLAGAPGPVWGVAAAAGAVPPGPFRFAGASGAPGAAAETLDDLLRLSVSHWDEARRALLDGRSERWLRGIGEVYIADLAGELAAREGEDPDALLREFLDRSGLDLGREARRREALAADARRRGDAAGEAALLGECRRLAPGRPADRVPLSLQERSRGRGLDRAVAEAGTIVAPAAPPAAAPPQAAGGAARARPAGRWWFWPLLALCLAPPAAALSGGGQDRLLPAWVASGFLSAMLLLVGLGVHVPLAARAVCLVPLAAGLVAAGAMTSALLTEQPSLDDVVEMAGLAALLLTILLIESATVTRSWRLWVVLVLSGIALAAAAFAAV